MSNPSRLVVVVVASITIASVAGCKGKNGDKREGSSSTTGTSGTATTTTSGSAAATGSGSGASAARPPVTLPPLAADPGGATGKAQWVVGLGGLHTDAARAVTVGSDESAMVVGVFEGDCTFGQAGKRTAVGGADAFVTRVDRDGRVTWVQTLGSGRDDAANGVAIGPAGQSLVVGNFVDKVTVGSITAKAVNSDDLFALALAPDGSPSWLWASGGLDSDGANAAAATPDGGWIVAGSFSATAKFGAESFKSQGGTDAILVKLTGEGQVVWARQFGGLYEDVLLHLAVDAAGNIYAQGQFADKASFGGEVLTSGGGSGSDIVLAKYDPDGTHLWSQRFGNAFDDVAGGVAVDPAGNVVMTGSFDRSIVIGDAEYQANGESDVVVARFGSDGAVTWARTFGAEREDIGYGIAADVAGNVIATGWFGSKVDFGGGALKSKGNRDVFVLKMNVKGDHVWSKSFGNTDYDQGRSLAVGPAGDPVLVGLFRFALDLTTPVVNSVRAEGDRAPKADVFVARLSR